MILWNGLAKGPTKKRARKLFGLVGGGVLFFLVYRWIFEIFSTLIQSPLGITLIDNFIIVIFLGFFIFLLASGITISIHYLFISNDLSLLMVSPLSNNTIFTFKLIEAIFANSTFFIFMGIPMFIAYGFINQAPWYYFPLMILDALFFLTIPVAISFLGALFIVRILPASRARELMAILLAVVTLGIWLALQIIRASTFDQTSQDFSPQTMTSLQQISQKAIFNLLPSTWAAKTLAGFIKLDWKAIVFNFLPLILLTIGIFLLCIQLSKRAFRLGMISADQAMTMKRKVKRQSDRTSGAFQFSLIFSNATGAIYLRDFKLFLRDTRQLVSILIFGVMMVLLPLIQRPDRIDSEFSLYYPYLFLIIFCAFMSAQISSRLIPMEAKAFWITKILPQASRRIILGKFLLAFSFSTLLSWLAVMIIGIYFQHPWRIFLLALTATFLVSGSLSAIGLLIGIYFPRFDWDHPKRMLSSIGGLLLSVSSLLIVAVIGGVAAVVYLIGNEFQLSQQSLDILVIGIVMILSAIAMIIAILMSARKFDRMEWEF